MIHLILFRSFLMTKSSWLAGDLEELMRMKLNNWMMICEKKDILENRVSKEEVKN
jgi:hypothetical protein